MHNFCFYYGSDKDIIDKMRKAASSIWDDVTERNFGKLHLFIPTIDFKYCYAAANNIVGVVSGYIRCSGIQKKTKDSNGHDLGHKFYFLNEISQSNGWPLRNYWTGCFAAISFTRSPDKLVLCNDLIGYIPLYYSFLKDGIIGGTNLIILAKSISSELDVIGLLQKIHPYYPICGSNFGRRTILKQFSRLLPGECIYISLPDMTYICSYDNTLCSNIIEGDINEIAYNVWERYQEEVLLSIENTKRVALALSGGWDSRLILAAIANEEKIIDCYTYGAENVYEVILAKRCAEAVGANFKAYSMESKYFPSIKDMQKIVLETESAYILNYWSIISDFENNKDKQLILIGDLADGLTGKGMREYNSRNYRAKLLLKSIFGAKLNIPSANKKNFEDWKTWRRNSIINETKRFVNVLSPEILKLYNEKSLVDEMSNDLELDFSIIENNMPEFEPMYEELFTWFHYTRYGMASQPLLLNYKFRAACPTMSLGFMRYISRVHPNIRLGKRLIDSIIKLPQLDKLADIPSAQVPWISSKSNRYLKEIVWGVRAILDDMYMKNYMKNKKIDGRAYFIEWHNLVKEYSRSESLKNVQNWFSSKWLSNSRFLDLMKRANFELWPNINSDIAIPATVSLILDLCEIP